MAILIKGMKMPKSCDSCPFRVRKRGEGFYSCVITGHFPIAIGDNDRSCECPLIEIPPHGRLIDADALMENAQYKGTHDIVTAWDIVAAPTIIPAEEGET